MNDDQLLSAMKERMLLVRRDICEINAEIRALEGEYRAKKLNLHEQRSAAQARCPHPDAKYHPDASGNNDSWHECRVCGAELR